MAAHREASTCGSAPPPAAPANKACAGRGAGHTWLVPPRGLHSSCCPVAETCKARLDQRRQRGLQGGGAAQRGHTSVAPAPMSARTARRAGLGGWVAYQRRLWKAGRLPLNHYHALAALGFQFDAFATRWGGGRSARVLWVLRVGPALPSPAALLRRLVTRSARPRHGSKRAAWRPGGVLGVVRYAAPGAPCPAAAAAARRCRWAARFRQLSEFHSRYGHCTVPPDAATEARWPGLRQWTFVQRQAWKRVGGWLVRAGRGGAGQARELGGLPPRLPAMHQARQRQQRRHRHEPSPPAIYLPPVCTPRHRATHAPQLLSA